MGAPAVRFYSTAQADAPPVQVVCVSPPLVVLGPRLTGGEAPLPEVRYWMGWAAELVRAERLMALGLPRADFDALLGALQRVFGAGAGAGAGGAGGAGGADTEHDELLRKTLPVKLRRRLQEMIRATSSAELDAGRYIAACERAASRAGLLASGDLPSAIALAGGAERAGHLIDVALDETYLDARATLGIGIR
jgi:hypothetical protein